MGERLTMYYKKYQQLMKSCGNDKEREADGKQIKDNMSEAE